MRLSVFATVSRTGYPEDILVSNSDDLQTFDGLIYTVVSIIQPESSHLLKKELNNRVLVLINPFSGQQQAEKLWAIHGAKVLQAASIQSDIIRTEYRQHATEIMLDLDIDRYDAVLVMSGDGLVTEIICGLLMRKDRERALKFPICHIPGGTSNALAAAICYTCKLYVVETQYDGTRSMFMSATWGLIADIDLGSERFRWAGMIRLHIEAILRILQLDKVATYRARLSYIPVNCKRTSRNTMLRFNCDRKLFGEGHFDYNDVDQATGHEPQRDANFSSMEEAIEDTSLVKIPPLDHPLDETWETVEGNWVMANVSTLSHLGSDIPFLPSARLDEITMYLTLIDWNTVKSRLHVGHLFTFMEGSKHLAHPCMQIIPVKAVRIEPLSEEGHFAIDGEPCRSGSSFQVVPSRFCSTVIGRKWST
uniref:Diacylglycerol kinase domain containing protein n=1 Tax=Haemonchus contortus TaxID=6289 RepID=W6NHR2_HAECO